MVGRHNARYNKAIPIYKHYCPENKERKQIKTNSNLVLWKDLTKDKIGEINTTLKKSRKESKVNLIKEFI